MERKSKTFTTPSGEVIRLYYIGYFAKQIDRTTDCIRLWERNRTIPETQSLCYNEFTLRRERECTGNKDAGLVNKRGSISDHQHP